MSHILFLWNSIMKDISGRYQNSSCYLNVQARAAVLCLRFVPLRALFSQEAWSFSQSKVSTCPISLLTVSLALGGLCHRLCIAKAFLALSPRLRYLEWTLIHLATQVI